MPSKYSGAEWLEWSLASWKCEPMSVHGRRVADVVGQVWKGIYHLPTSSLRKGTWSDTHYVSFFIPFGLDTYDGNLLTALVVLCHDAGMRLEVSPRGFRYLQLGFTQRRMREGGSGVWDRMPTLERHIEGIRGNIGGEAAPGFPSTVEAAS